MQLGSQAAYIDPPPTGPNAHLVNRADQFVKCFLVRDPGFKLLKLDIRNPGPWQARIVALSQLIDAKHPDWSAFGARGGKLILVQGHDDPSVSPHANQAFDANAANRNRSRPMCAFPTWPRYQGSGPVDGAASFSCAAP